MSIEDGSRPFGVAERLDDVLLRFDGWRARPGLALSAGVLLLATATVAWWLGQAAPEPPLDDLIPMAQPESGRGVEPSTSSDEQQSPVAAAQGPGVSDGWGGADRSAGLGGAVGDDGGAVPAADEPDLVIHVVGAVRAPGLVTVAAGSRVGDVVSAAGGAVDGADTQRLNLAAPVSDGMQVRVPLVDADPDEPLIVTPVPTTMRQSEQTSGPIDLNAASSEQLQSLPGVGPAIAAAIVSWREENGGFTKPEDLLQVPGIGPAKMGALRDLVTA